MDMTEKVIFVVNIVIVVLSIKLEMIAVYFNTFVKLDIGLVTILSYILLLIQ